MGGLGIGHTPVEPSMRIGVVLNVLATSTQLYISSRSHVHTTTVNLTDWATIGLRAVADQIRDFIMYCNNRPDVSSLPPPLAAS